jgi:hypothetical protein
MQKVLLAIIAGASLSTSTGNTGYIPKQSGNYNGRFRVSVNPVPYVAIKPVLVI